MAPFYYLWHESLICAEDPQAMTSDCDLPPLKHAAAFHNKTHTKMTTTSKQTECKATDIWISGRADHDKREPSSCEATFPAAPLQ